MEKSTHLQTIAQLAMAAADGWHGGIALGVADAECSERDSCNIYSRNSAEGAALTVWI